MDGDGVRSADGTRDGGRTRPGRHRGLLVGFAGVLTSSVIGSFHAFCEAEGLAVDALFGRLAGDPVARRLVADLECGRIDEALFEPGLAEALGVRPEGLIDRRTLGMATVHHTDPAQKAAALEALLEVPLRP